MEKVRFEAFNVEELRVLRRSCYEAGAAFGDPGHTAAERETLDDLAVEILGELKKKEAAAARQKQEEPLEKTAAKAVEDSLKDVVGKLPFAPKVFQSPAPPKERVVQRPDIPAKAKPTPPAESAHMAPELPAAAKFTGFLYVRCEKCGQERGFCAKRLFLRATAGSAAGKRSSKICAGSRSGASAAALTATTRTSRMPHLICLARTARPPWRLNGTKIRTDTSP